MFILGHFNKIYRLLVCSGGVFRMKCIIVFFSLTGNTEKVARAIQTGVKQAAGNCDILPIKEANPKRLYEYDLIGFGSPVMGGGTFPINIRNYIKGDAFCR